MLWHDFVESVYGVSPLVSSFEDVDRDASCLTCRDMGWVYPTFEGKVRYMAQPCPNCSHWQERAAQYALAASGIPDAKRCCNFESFKPRPGNEEAVGAAYSLGKGTASFKMLLLYGTNGNGKTHLAYAAGLEALKRGLKVRFRHVGKLISDLRLAIGRGESADEIIDQLRSCDFLILDDMGSGQDTNYQLVVLEDIINHRYASEMETVATTDNPDNLTRPLVSRFRDASLSRCIWNQAPDFRPGKSVSNAGQGRAIAIEKPNGE